MVRTNAYVKSQCWGTGSGFAICRASGAGVLDDLLNL